MKNIRLALIAVALTLGTPVLLFAEEPAQDVAKEGDSSLVASAADEVAETKKELTEAAEQVVEKTEEVATAVTEKVEEQIADSQKEDVTTPEEKTMEEAETAQTTSVADKTEDEVAEPASEEAEEEEYDEDTYGPETPIVWTHPIQAVVFDHKIHTMEAGLDCDSCHDDLFEMEAGAASENEDFIMETMYEGGYCGACHDGETAFAANTRCATCHIGAMGVKDNEKESDNADH